jgi:F0F1-type ATP synthase assembly protein I
MVNVKKKNINEGNNLSMLSLAWNLGWTIALPIVLLATGGAMLDKQIGTSPWMLLLGVGFSIVITSAMVYYKTMKVLGTINGTSKSGDTSDND